MIRTETSKLRALRSKTDQQLVEIISRALDAALVLGRNPESRARAQEAYCQVRRLLPYVSRLDMRLLEPRIEEIAALLYPTAKAACF